MQNFVRNIALRSSKVRTFLGTQELGSDVYTSSMRVVYIYAGKLQLIGILYVIYSLLSTFFGRAINHDASFPVLFRLS